MAPALRHVLPRHARLLAASVGGAVALGLVAAPTAANATLAGRQGSRTAQQQRGTPRAAAKAPGTGAHPASAQSYLPQEMLWARIAAAHGRPLTSSRSGTITGLVLSTAGRPLAGACVTAIGRSRSMTATAAPTGRFVLSGLAAGSYTLEYRDCGAPARYLPRWSGGVAWPSAATRFALAAGQQRAVLPMVLRPASPATLLPSQHALRRMLAAGRSRMRISAAAKKTGQIGGVVTGKKRKLRGICVVTFPIQGGQGYSGSTAKDGSYRIRNLPPGRYQVTFASQFFCPGKANWLEQTYRGQNNPFETGATPVRVRSGKTTGGIDTNLLLGGEISGTVQARSGRKLAGICVNAEGKIVGGYDGLEAATARNGSYHLHALFPGRYAISFSIGCGSKGNYAAKALRPIRLSYGERVTAAGATLVPGGSITGTVRLGSSIGKLLPGICVFASNASGSVSSNAATNANGSYRVIGLSTGTYQLQFQPGCNSAGNYTSATKYAHATQGKVTSGVDAVLQRGAEISGVVTDVHGKPLANICVDVEGNITSADGLPEGTNPNGSYVVNQLAAGTYEIGFTGGCGNTGSYAPYWYDNQGDQDLATPITLATGGSQTVNAQLQPGGTVTGTVADSRGRKLSGICVYVATEQQAELGAVFQADTGTYNGRYELSNLEPGQYLVNFGCGLSTKYADQWFSDAPSAGSAELVSVGHGQTSGINAVLRPGGSISGVVTGRSGRPLANVCVYAFNSQERTDQFETIGFPGPATNSRGRYELTGLAAGSYDVAFDPSCTEFSHYSMQWYRNKVAQPSANAVKVRSRGVTSGIDARLTLGGTISGRVVNAIGQPLSNICPFAYNSAGQFGFGQTGTNGTYTMVGMSSGRYTVEFSSCNGANLVTVLKPARVVAPKATKGVDARLVPGGSVAGVVTTAAPPVPVANVCAEVISSNPDNVGSVSVTDANGSYLATGLAPGSYQVYLGDPLCFLPVPDLAPQWYDNQPTQATANTITVTVGHTTSGINAGLEVDGTITGTVRGPSSAAVHGACISAMPQISGALPILAVSATNGSYTLTDLLPGRYKVEFSSGCGATGYRSQWWRDASSRATASIITVSADQTVSGISAQLSR
jgi:Carboxypeptidase regulatory-like domain